MKPLDLEGFKAALTDDRQWAAIGKILQLGLASDRSTWRAKVKLMPDGEEVIARIGWPMVAPRAGMYGPADVDDLVVVVFPGAEEEHGVVIARLSSTEDQIPLRAAAGNTQIRQHDGKNLYLGGAGLVLIGRNGDEDPDPAQPLVLGNELATMLSGLMTAIATHTHLGNLGAPTTPPANAATFTGYKASPIDDGEILSDVAFTEKGNEVMD